MAIFQYLSKVIFMGFLITMFVLRYVKVHKSIEADKRRDIIKLKNVLDNDLTYGAVTMTFFPINIILLPFLVPLLIMKSERLNDTILKVQYFVLILCYISLGAVISVVLIPLLYLKTILNSAYIGLYNKRAKYRGEGFANLIFSIFLGPFVITLSIITDFFMLNVILMKEEHSFEFKY